MIPRPETVKPAGLRLEPLRPGEQYYACGWGANRTYREAPGRVVGQLSSSSYDMGGFGMASRARQGDSGGPIIDQQGKVCGVLWGQSPDGHRPSTVATAGQSFIRWGQLAEQPRFGRGQQQPALSSIPQHLRTQYQCPNGQCPNGICQNPAQQYGMGQQEWNSIPRTRPQVYGDAPPNDWKSTQPVNPPDPAPRPALVDDELESRIDRLESTSTLHGESLTALTQIVTSLAQRPPQQAVPPASSVAKQPAAQPAPRTWKADTGDFGKTPAGKPAPKWRAKVDGDTITIERAK